MWPGTSDIVSTRADANDACDRRAKGLSVVGAPVLLPIRKTNGVIE